MWGHKQRKVDAVEIITEITGEIKEHDLKDVHIAIDIGALFPVLEYFVVNVIAAMIWFVALSVFRIALLMRKDWKKNQKYKIF